MGESRKTVAKRDANEVTQTPRLRAHVGTHGEIGVERHDGRKPEAGEGAGLGSVGVTGNPVARSERKRHEKTCERNCVRVGFMAGYGKQAGKFAGGAWER